MKFLQLINNIVHAKMSTGIAGMLVVISLFTPLTSSWAIDNSDYMAVPPFLSTEVKPNVLFIIDNSNSMDEDVNGAAVGSASPLSRSEIARKAILQIINENKDTMRFGVMAYEQTGVEKRYVHNSFYYASYDSTTFHPDHVPSPKDPTDNTKRFPNPSEADAFIYYDTALPVYSGGNQGNGFCYSGNYTEDGNSRNDMYHCYHSKTGDQTTPEHLPNSAGEDETDYGYSVPFVDNDSNPINYHFVPTDDDFAAGFTEFGYETSWVPVSDTWFSNTNPGGGILHADIADSTDAHLGDIQAKLATSQFAINTDTPLRNAGLTPLAGTLNSARAYFRNAGVTTASGVTANNPITLSCQKNYIILVTDGLPSVDSTGTAGDADTLLPEVEASIAALRTTDNPSFSNNFDIKTFVVGFAIPDELGSKLDALAVAGGTDDNGHALLAHNATELAAKLKKAFLGIKSSISSGAAASVISNTRSGEGVVYQSVFYPEFEDAFHNKVAWVGNVNALFVDAFGNLREDTNRNHMLDIYPEDGCQFASDPYLSSWCNNGRVDTEDQDGDWFLDQHDEDNLSIATHEDWNGNGVLDDEDVDDDGVVDIDEDLQEFPMYPEWYNNGLLDDEDVDNDGKLDVDEDQVDHGIPGWIGNRDTHPAPDTEDVDGDGHLDHGEDLNNNGVMDTEDLDHDGILDVNEDRNGNGIIDSEDYDGDGKLDYAEDTNDNGIVDTEDLDGDGRLDVDEDLNHNGRLDFEVDHNGNGIFDSTDFIIVYGHDENGAKAFRYEDTNGNGRLDLNEDLNGNGQLDYDLNEDVNGNGVLDPGEDLNHNNILDADVDEDRNGNGLLDIDEDANGNGVMDTGEDLNGDGKFYTEDTLIDTVPLEDINYVWDASSWLNEISDADIIRQRIYGQADDRRYIFTFTDQNNNKIVDDGEAIAFVTDDSDQPDNYDKLASYLTEYPHKSDEPDWVQTIRDDGNWNHFLARQTKRTINFIRGMDEGEYTSTTSTPYTLPAMRARKVDYDKDGTLEIWRLGDIIHSAPTLVARPAEEYHLLYNDSSYAEFADKYAYRRNVVYVGGNDGMIHAFNGGFFDSINLGLSLRSKTKAEQYFDANHNNQWDAGEPFFDVDGDGVYDAGFGSETPYPLGMELWAYIPENLLPHLRWLTLPDYQHVYYNDLRPKVVDAKIFTEESVCTTSTEKIYDDGCIHPHGWGTLLISGMRFGGGEYPKSATWDFDTDAAGWSFNNTNVSQTFADGAWTIETTHGIVNPAILSPDDLEIDTSRVKTVEIRFLTTAMDAGAGGARLYWDIDGNGNFTEGSQTIDAPSVDTSGNYYVYTFDMSNNDHWAGIVKQLRIDPQGAFTAGSKVSIDYVDLGDGKGYVSSYILMDVTNPEKAPKILAEINVLGLGYTTNFPTVVPLKSKTDSGKNDWYLVFGSGINHNSLADPEALNNADSNTTGKVFVLSLNQLVSQHKIMMLDSSGTLHDIHEDGEQTFATLDEKSFISDMITVDFDLDYDADVVYFGTVSGNETEGWGGKLRRILLNDGDADPSNWNGDSVLFTLADNQSITAKPNISIDDKKNFWVYFGAGRFYTRDDINISDTQSYFGIKEPVDTDGDRTFAEVPATDLLNTTNAVVYDDKTVTGMGNLNTWDKLMAEIDTNKSGWTIDFPRQRERNLGQAAVLGGILTFTTYQPSADPCSTDGWSYGYGVYYKTGTSYYKSIFGFDFTDKNSNGIVDDGVGEKKIEKSFMIGAGLALSPSIHVGSKEKGTKAFFQTSSGSIFGMSEDNPGLTKSSKVSWGQIQ